MLAGPHRRAMEVMLLWARRSCTAGAACDAVVVCVGGSVSSPQWSPEVRRYGCSIAYDSSIFQIRVVYKFINKGLSLPAVVNGGSITVCHRELLLLKYRTSHGLRSCGVTPLQTARIGSGWLWLVGGCPLPTAPFFLWGEPIGTSCQYRCNPNSCVSCAGACGVQECK